MTEQNPPVDTPVEYKPAVDVEQKKTTEVESAPNSNSEEKKRSTGKKSLRSPFQKEKLKQIKFREIMVPGGGLEPPTFGL